MIYRFDQFELDLDKAELRHDGIVSHLEPQVYALLVLLVQNQARMVSKDEIVEKIWDGRFVSDSAVSSRIKSLRQALGDSGAQQQFIKTVHGRGLRFTDRGKPAHVLLTIEDYRRLRGERAMSLQQALTPKTVSRDFDFEPLKPGQISKPADLG